MSCFFHQAPYKGDDERYVSVIEQDILDRDLGITFKDIASLDDAKQLLNEAVMLPLIIPEFFTGISNDDHDKDDKDDTNDNDCYDNSQAAAR